MSSIASENLGPTSFAEDVFNIIPLHGNSSLYSDQRFPEIQAALTLLEDAQRILGEMPALQDNSKPTDVFSQLQVIFGFQEDSVKNQREHLVMLLAGIHARKPPSEEGSINPPNTISSETVAAVLHNLTANYHYWCTFHKLQSSISLPDDATAAMHKSIVYIALWLLVWGEAANVRFMPEGLCYIYHHMAKDPGLGLQEDISQRGFGFVITDYLDQVIKPIYNVIAKEASNSRLGDHAKWRNYDDLNEFFWSKKCHKLGWPMDPENNFFGLVTAPTFNRQTSAPCMGSITSRQTRPSLTRSVSAPPKVKKATKENWVEVRTVLQIVRSFQSIWVFYILLFQALFILAWSAPPWYKAFQDFNLLLGLLSLVVTYAGAETVFAFIDILLSWKLRRSILSDNIITLVVTFLYHGIFFIFLLFTYQRCITD